MLKGRRVELDEVGSRVYAWLNDFQDKLEVKINYDF